MTTTGADLFADAIDQYGVDHLFGNPGTTELPIVRALADRDVGYVLGLHEDVAVGMAAGYASTRRYQSHEVGGPPDGVNPLGVVNLHITPGTAHGLGNVFAAEYSGVPLLVTAGNHERDFRTEEPILTGDLVSMTEPFTKWSDEVLSVEAVPRMVRRAVRTALTPPTGPVFLALPMDVMRAETDAGVEPLGQIPTAGRGDRAQLERAAELIATGDDPVLVLGDGVARSGAVADAVALAEAMGARVHPEIMAAEANFPEDHPQFVSHIPPDEEMASLLLDARTIVFVGTSTNTTLMRHEGAIVPDDATCIHVSQDAWEVGKNQRADAAVIGDPGAVMAELATLVEERLPADERTARIQNVEAIATALEETVRSMGESERDESPLPSKAETVDALRDVAPDAFLVDEGVTAKYALMTRWPFEAGTFVGSKSGGLGYGLPAAVGAALAESQRPETMEQETRDVVAHVGDGAYQYYPQAIFSAARLDLDLTVVVQNNRRYRILERNAAKLFGGTADDQALPGMELTPTIDVAANAESYGASSFTIDRPAELESAFERAIAEDGTTVVDVHVHD